jgi:bifunctional polynucleotide phosphatase/kinase
MLASPTEISKEKEEEEEEEEEVKEAGPVRVAAFDFDGTLVVPKSGKTHPTAASDWALWNPAVANRLRQLHAEGYRLAIFTNQKQGAKGLTREARKQRVEQAVAAIGVPMDVFMAFEDDIYRKPCPGMWELFVSLLGRVVDMSASFFVGDAAGRPAAGPRKRDFSASDRQFAENIGLTFHTPEQFFLSSREKLPDGNAHPLAAHDTISLEEAVEELARPVGSPEIVLFFGSPGSGKSTLATTVFASYARANQDLLKTKKKCFDVAESALQEGKSVVVDNTNRNRDTRREWIDFARAHGVPIRCVVVKASKDVCFHLNKFRGVSEPGGGRMVPSMVIHSFFKSAEQPSADEGFDRIDQWPFRVLEHDCVQAPHLLRMHLA